MVRSSLAGSGLALALGAAAATPLACAYDYDGAFGDQDGPTSAAGGSAVASAASTGGAGGAPSTGGGGNGGEPPAKCPGATAEDPPPWARSFGSSADGERVTGLAVDAHGAIVFGGSVAGDHDDWLFPASPGGLDTDAFLARVSAAGEVLWSTRFAGGGGSADLLHDLAVGPDVVVATFTAPGGLSQGTSLLGSGALLAAFALADGSLLWAQQLGAAAVNEPHAVALQPGNGSPSGVVVGGRFDGTLDFGGGLKATSLASGFDGYVAVFDLGAPARAVRWVQSPGSDRILDVATDETGKVFATGTLGQPATVCVPHNAIDDQETVLVMRLGNDLGCGGGWSKVFGGTSVQVGNAVAVGGGELYVAGSFRGIMPGLPSTGGATDGFVMRINPTSGNAAWLTAFGGSAVGDFDTVTGLTISPNGVVAAGFFSSGGKAYDEGGDLGALVGHGGLDMFASMLDKSGKPQALEAWGDEAEQSADGGNALRVVTVPRGLVAGGSLRGAAVIEGTPLTSVGGADAWVGRICEPSTPLP